MDPITTALVAATSAGLVAGATKTGEQAITDAYTSIKDLLKRKFGAKSEVIKAVEALETKPDSAARKEMVREEIAAVHADQDTELLQAARLLLDKLDVKSDVKITQTAIGDQNIQVTGSNDSINVNTRSSKS